MKPRTLQEEVARIKAMMLLEDSNTSYIDSILDKISSNGIESLSQEERGDLDSYSKGEKIHDPQGTVAFGDDGDIEFDDEMEREMDNDRELFQKYHGCHKDCESCVIFFDNLPQYLMAHNFNGFKVKLDEIPSMEKVILIYYNDRVFAIQSFVYQEKPSEKDTFEIYEMDKGSELYKIYSLNHIKKFEVPSIPDTEAGVYKFTEYLFNNIIPNFLKTI